MRLARLAVFALLVAPAALVAQDRQSDAEWLEQCRESNNRWSSDARGRACEVRNVPVRLSARAIAIDGERNGGIRVFGWDGDSVKVTARLQAEGRSDADARDRLSRVRVLADGRGVRAEGPSMDYDYGGWSVSYYAFVPRRFDLDLEAHNGGLSVDGVSGKLDLRTHNGGLRLSAVGGDVHARTQNGSLHVELTGNRWDGTGLEAETRNGSVRLAVPEPYAALLETGTVNGSIRTDIPVTLSGRISRQLSIPLGGGGRTIRATTTNGSVTITRR
ncbi:MAG TPA: DUF4097 family beta strand repeat-containing protein [Gemmatimonadaceae bacterium]|nr:DUF4097 family beta strand repeat-containing protein [Gemmatimonadaceae bacterium]